MSPAAVTPGALHHAILSHLVRDGYAPSRTALARQFDTNLDEIHRALHVLADAHGVVLHPHAPDVWIVHPFSTAPTAFAVRRGSRVWWANCAWCALGAAALLGGDGITIETTIGGEGQPVTIHVDNQRVREALFVHFPVPMTLAWDNVIYTCSTMLVFERAQDVDAWSRRHAIPRGDVQPIQRIYDFAAVWYGRHLDPGWTKWTVGEAHEIFTRFGLTGPIWDLAPATDRF